MHRNSALVAETISIFVLLSFAAVGIHAIGLNPSLCNILYLPILLFQGLWFYRFYIVGHEAAHKKLFPHRERLNDFWGAVILLPLMTPINIYRKIHYFHHGFNRKDHHTSALDTFVTKGNITIWKKIYYHLVWYISVFFGGFFIHSFISVILFLFVPPKISRKISPAFNNWTAKDQLLAILLFSCGVALHLGVYFLLGVKNYLYILGFPMLAFAWILSLLVYIFHYDTTKGSETRYHVRSVNRVPVISWILMNFNEHATHHQYPGIPWYDLPEKRHELPAPYASKNQNTRNLFTAIANQIKGPIIIHELHD